MNVKMLVPQYDEKGATVPIDCAQFRRELIRLDGAGSLHGHYQPGTQFLDIHRHESMGWHPWHALVAR